MGTIDVIKINKSSSLKDILDAVLDESREVIERDGEVDPALIILEEPPRVLDIPEGHQEMAAFFVNAADKYRGSRGYVFITESWSLSVSTEDMNEVNKYLFDPTSIALNPFRKERIVFNAKSKDESYEGYIELERDEEGKAVLGKTVFENEKKEHFGANVADLLETMVE
jgi:hypothetical protein